MFTICLHGTFENKTFLKAVLGTDVTPTVSATPEKVTGKLASFNLNSYITQLVEQGEYLLASRLESQLAELVEQETTTLVEQGKRARAYLAMTESPNLFYGNALGTIRTGDRGGTAPPTIAIIGGDDEYLQQVDFIIAHS